MSASDERSNGFKGALVFIAGVLFWAHGTKYNNPWFEGEQLTGEILIGASFLIPWCYCIAKLRTARLNHSEDNNNPQETVSTTEPVLARAREIELVFSIFVTERNENVATSVPIAEDLEGQTSQAVRII
jgi:hypothetical protein